MFLQDKNNYQTVYADPAGSVAAPTAGLHFTPELLEKIKNKGVKIVYITLHVGLGTFLPVQTENIADHQIQSEWAQIPAETLKTITEAKKSGNKIFAVGTTTTRTLEFFADKFGIVAGWPARIATPASSVERGSSGWRSVAGGVNIFIYPPYKFKIVDGLITNFHLPKSSLLMLVSALAGKANIDRAYQEAISQKYRFYSYGDAMLII